MKNINIYFLRRLLVVAISILFLGITALQAQIGPSPQATNTPNFGIYGSAPTPSSTPWTCGDPRYARITTYPEMDPSDGFSQTIPLNGLKNFNFYYNADGTGFLSGGGYRVRYLNASQANCYPDDIVSYSPNRAHTNGVQVRPFNSPTLTPLGMSGVVLARIPGGGGTTTYLENAIAAVGDNAPIFPERAKTNGLGYFSIYYSTQNPGEFVFPDTAYDIRISGFQNGCSYVWERSRWVVWLPFYGLGDPQHYVTGAEQGLGTIIIDSLDPGCQP